MIKKNFYFTVKALAVLKTTNFFSEFPYQVGKRLDKKPKVNCEFYDVTNREKNLRYTYFPDISRSKDNQKIK